MEIEIKRAMTINVGDFSNIQPHVSIKFNIDEDFDQKYLSASTMLEELFKLETAILSYEYADLREKGKFKYSEEVMDNSLERLNNIKECFNKLK
jgi:hypothetical protein